MLCKILASSLWPYALGIDLRPWCKHKCQDAVWDLLSGTPLASMCCLILSVGIPVAVPCCMAGLSPSRHTPSGSPVRASAVPWQAVSPL